LRRGLRGRAQNPYFLEDLKEELLADLEEELENRSYRGQRYSRRDLMRLRSELFRELKAVRAIENRTRRPRSPEVRELMREIIDLAGEQGMSVDELYGVFPRLGRPSPGERVAGFFQSRGGLMVLLALLALLAVPSSRQKISSLLQKIIAEAGDLTGQLKGFFARLGEGIEDIIAEAQFERIKESVENIVSEENGRPDNEQGE